MKRRAILVTICGVAVLLAFGYLSLPKTSLSIAYIELLAEMLSIWVAQAPILSFLVCLLCYTMVCSIPFPLISVLTILMGYLFGLEYGLLIASFGSALGGSLLFLVSKRIMNEHRIKVLVARFPALAPATKSQSFAAAVSIRFIPGLPFFAPSLLLSVTRISLLKFYCATQLGLLLTVAVYVNAGSSIAGLSFSQGSVEGLFSPRLIASMLMLVCMPMLLKIIQRKAKANALP